MQSRKVFLPLQPPLHPRVSEKKGKARSQQEPINILKYTLCVMESTFFLKIFLTLIANSCFLDLLPVVILGFIFIALLSYYYGFLGPIFSSFLDHVLFG